MQLDYALNYKLPKQLKTYNKNRLNDVNPKFVLNFGSYQLSAGTFFVYIKMFKENISIKTKVDQFLIKANAESAILRPNSLKLARQIPKVFYVRTHTL